MPERRTTSLSRAVSALTVTALLCAPAAALPASAVTSQPTAPPDTLLKVDTDMSTPPEGAGQQPERIIVKFKNGVTADARGKAYGQAAVQAGVSVKELRGTATGATVVQAAEDITDAKADQLAAALERHPAVEYAEVDTFLRPSAAPNDELYSYQWSLHEERAGMRVPDAWNQSTGTGTVVAVIDTGITAHTDLSPNLVSGYDFITDPTVAGDGNGRDPDSTDVGDSCQGGTSSWHGTHVAGTVGAYTDPGAATNEGVVGVAYGAKIQPIRALGSCGGYLSDVSDAVIWAAGGSITGVPANTTPAKVVNLSLGGAGQCSTSFQSALDFAASRGTVVVAAAGNSNAPAANHTPANCSNIVTVGSTGREGSRAGYSNYGPEVDVSAPGGDASTGYLSAILSTYNDGDYTPGQQAYGFMQGTSMAAPHVAGAAALILSANPSLTPAQVEETLKKTARTLPGACTTGGCGTGLVDAAAAVQAAKSTQAADFTSTPTPTIGSATVGSPVLADPLRDRWSPAPDTFAYQWLRNGATIIGATETSYTPVEADRGTNLTFSVTAAKAGYKTTTVTSAPTTVQGSNQHSAPAPVITGDLRVGSVLTAAVDDTWTPGPVAVQYQWFRGSTAITGATSSSYTTVPADAGHVLRVLAKGEGPGFPYTEVFSKWTSTIALGVLNSTTPTVTGQAAVGNQLQSEAGEWTQGTALRYQWFRSGTAISGATASAYTPTTADLGNEIRVRVIGYKNGYATASRDSAPTEAVAPGTLTAPAPTVSGTVKVGHSLTANAGTWTPRTTLKYQWFRSGVAIVGATSNYYPLGASDLDKTMTVRVTGTKSGYTTVTTESAATTATTAVAAGTLNGPVPTLSGTAKVGYFLTVKAGKWTSGTTLKYQWYRNGVAIAGATSSWYTLVAADRSQSIRVGVTGSKPGYTTLTQQSAPVTVS